jgi:hypothetical protein
MAGRLGCHTAAVAGQPVRAARVFAGWIRLGTQRCAGALPDVAPARGWYRSCERDDHPPAWRRGRV